MRPGPASQPGESVIAPSIYHDLWEANLTTGKRVLNLAYDAPLGAGLEIEGLAYGLLRSSDDFVEGVNAFVEKRDPKYTGH